MASKKRRGGPEFERVLFDNGLVLLVSENRRLPLVSLNAFVLAGLDQNPMDQPGLASMTARMLDEGTERYDYRQIAEMLEGTGSALSIFSQRELSGINLQIKSEDTERSVELLAEMLRRPVFPAGRFELEKQKALNHLRSMEDDPQTVAGNIFDSLIYSGTPLQYPVLGVSANLARLETCDLARFHRLKYGPPSTILVAVGDLSTDWIKAKMGEEFGDWVASDFKRTLLPPIRRQDHPIVEQRPLDKEQVHILVGHLGIKRQHPDHTPLQTLDVILGSGPGFTSRIPRKLRDEQGLAYATYSDIAGSCGIYPGRFAAYICTSPGNRSRALEGLLGEIREVVNHGVTEQELETAKDYLTGSFVFETQSNLTVARLLLSIEVFKLGADYARRYPQIVRSVSRADVERVARRHLDTVNYTTVTVGPV
jgi:zinc protease